MKKGKFLQVFMTFGATLGTYVAAWLALTSLASSPSTPINSLGAIVVVAIVVVCTLSITCAAHFLSLKLFRWYNTEQAIARSLEENIPFRDALMEECDWRRWMPFCFAGFISSVFKSVVNCDVPAVQTITIMAAILLYAAIITTMAVVAVKALRLYLARRPENDRRIPIYNRLTEVNGIKMTAPLMLPVSKAPKFYH